jgi:hypothetical protein
VSSPKPLRNLDRERRFLVDVAPASPTFVQAVQARLQAGDEQYGDSWAWIGVRKHLAELMEEAVDLAGWAVLCEQALDQQTMSETSRRRLSAVLRVVARRGARAHELLAQTLRIIDNEELAA